jgi:hypothetical protein
LLYTQQRRLLFPASSVRTEAAQTGISGLQDVTIATPDGVELVAWWKPPEPGRALILYFHGNGGSLGNRRERVRLLTSEGRGMPHRELPRIFGLNRLSFGRGAAHRCPGRAGLARLLPARAHRAAMASHSERA